MRRGVGPRLLMAIAGGLLAGLFGLTGAAPAAAAAADDSVDAMTIRYTVAPDGVLTVEETIVYRFGSSSGRHGIYRDLVVREPYADDASRDQRYEVSDIAVRSPSGDSAEFSKQVSRTNRGRDQVLRIRIGSQDRVVVAPTATYVINYRVRGALRHFDDHSELYWDATGSAWAATLNTVTVSVTVPDGVERVACFAGPPGSTHDCATKAVSGSNGVFTQAALPPGSGLTIVAGIKAGVVRNDSPIMDDPPGLLERAGISVPSLAGSGLVILGVPLAGVAMARRATRDDRFTGLPPGALPPSGTKAAVGKNALADDRIPVAFAPPRIPVAEAGLLIDAVANTRETAATLIDLAVRGGVRIDDTGTEQRAVLVDAAVATEPHEQALLSMLYPDGRSGQAVELKRRGVGDTSMRKAHDAMVRAVRQQVTARGYYSRLPSGLRGGARSPRSGCGWLFGIGLLSVLGAALSGAGTAMTGSRLGSAVVFWLPLVTIVGTLAYVVVSRARGRRTAVGRALTDQVVGFRSYLATAEAEQLRFEEGADIFSRYLPWAIVFDLADRWQRVCAELVAAGRIPAEPAWYAGPPYYSSGFGAGSIGDTVSHTFDPPPAPAGTGGGRSSGFGGGSSGGGGGGGGGGSW